jgi:hypothetical protein
MHIRRSLFLALAASLGVTAAARAQAPFADTARVEGAPAAVRELAVGDTVRLRCPSGRYAGRVSRITGDSLFVVSPKREDGVGRANVSELYRLTGRASRGRTILIGAGAGLVGGTALGLLGGRMAGRIDQCGALDGSGCRPGSHDRTAVGSITAGGALIGSLVGAMIGPAFRRTHWEPLSARSSDAPQIHAAPAAGGGVEVGGRLKL